MRKLTYLAVFEPSNDGYGVFFPDFPGCISFGKNISESQINAKEALELHVYGMENDSDELPAASNELDAKEYEGCIISPVTIFPDLVKNDMDNKRVKTNTTIPRWLKEIGEENNVNFSQLLEVSLIEYLGLENRKNIL